MRKTDISRYKNNNQRKAVHTNVALEGTKGFFSVLWKGLSTVLMILVVTGIVFTISLSIYLFNLANQPTGINLTEEKSQMTSFIMVQNSKGKDVEFSKLYGLEDRVWVDFDQIPQQMKDAMTAIEDKRFEDHHGVDWVRTFGAIFKLSSGEASFGGSTLTQQLIKNITGDNEVSLTRKLNEIFRALNLEREYTKDQILEAYLNIVNFGEGCYGVQAASKLYFGKEIQDCSIAQCAAIAGITQNPSAFTPLSYPQDNKERRETVIDEMYDQGKISKQEHKDAMEESDNMTFVGHVAEDEDEENEEEKEQTDKLKSNWFIDALLRDVQQDLKKELNLSDEMAWSRVYTGGLRIHATMDLELQEYAQKYIQTYDTYPDRNLEIAAVIMGLDGRMLATVGGRDPKNASLVFDRANQANLQPGSTIKPLFPYPMAIEENIYHYSSTVNDSALYQPNDSGNPTPGFSWPTNVYQTYRGDMLLTNAIAVSSNATSVQTMDLDELGPKKAYQQAINRMGFRNLDPVDVDSLGALSLGSAMVTVREMAAAYQYMGNGGKHYEPYTYFYVEDREGNVLLDNRENIPIQSYSADTATIMNRLLHYNVYQYEGENRTSAWQAKVGNWDILGKTGTTDNNKDHWFTGLSPYASCAVWTGFDDPASMSNDSYVHAVTVFQHIMEKYLDGKEYKEFSLSKNVETHLYCADTGLLAGSGCYNTYTGYYKPDFKPDYCSGWHSGYSSSNNYDYNNDYWYDYSASSTADDDWSASSYDDTSASDSSAWVDPGETGDSSTGDIIDNSDPGGTADNSNVYVDPGETDNVPVE